MDELAVQVRRIHGECVFLTYGGSSAYVLIGGCASMCVAAHLVTVARTSAIFGGQAPRPRLFFSCTRGVDYLPDRRPKLRGRWLAACD